jgi:PAS domain S-box-containing protein
MAPESHDLMAEQIRATVPQPFEVVGQRKDGSTFPLEIFSKNIPFDGRTVAVAAVRDITERKQTEEALRTSEERFRLLAENAQDIVFRYRFGERRGFEYVSPSATAITGYTPEEWYADPDIAAMAVHPDDREEFQQAIASRRTETGELRAVRKDGKVICVEQRSVPIFDDTGSIVAIEGIIRDVTERKRAEEALQRAREELEAKVERQMSRENPYRLTFRELTILHLVAAGRADKEIAREFGISLRTAQKHVANIRAKMKTGSRTEVGVRAIKEGLLQ